MTELEEEILKEIALKPYLWWGYIDETFFLWEHGEDVGCYSFSYRGKSYNRFIRQTY